MTLRKIIILVFTLIPLVSFSQTDFRPGFVIKNTGDTIYGNIDYRGDLIMGQLCKFKTQQDSINFFKPNEIKGYRFTDNKYFISKEIEGAKVFLEYLLAGIVNLYYLRNDLGDHYYIERDTVPITELINKKTDTIVDDRTFIYESKNYVRTLNLFMHDANGIQPRIAAIKDIQQRDLINIAEFYHNSVCKDKSCIIFEKKQTFLQIFIEPCIGFNWYNKLNLTQFEYGSYLYFWAPRTNEKLYLKTGILISSVSYPENFESNNATVTRVPFLLQYYSSSRLVNPRISIGLNYLRLRPRNISPDYFTACFFVGVGIKESKKLSLILDFGVESVPIGEPGDGLSLLDYSGHLGLMIKI